MGRISGDRALAGDGEDKLGFGPTAECLAQALAAGTSSGGLVVGVTGRWGSGKSSLLNLTQAAIRRGDLAARPHVVEFQPWLVGDRDALLQALFAELVDGIDQIALEAGDASGVTWRKVGRAATELRQFAGLLGAAGNVGSTWFGLPLVGRIFESLFEWLYKGRPKSLAASKKKVCNRLAKLKRALVVVIDDVDRLDPTEIVEVLRLVRSVADFPNITYVLSYDEDIVSHAVCAATKVKDLKDSDGIPAPKVQYRISENSWKAMDYMLDRMTEMHQAAGARHVFRHRLWTEQPGHLLGTARCGDDPTRSVVDRWGRAHDVPNLFIVDGSVMVTSGAVNPTATIAAWALRCAEHIIETKRDFVG